MREYGVKADFTIYEKDSEEQDRVVFNKTIASDINLEEYGILPVEVINQWRKVFDKSYVIAEIMKRMKKPTLHEEPDKEVLIK